MAIVKINIGTTYCGCKSETIELECDSKEEFDSHEFSTEILNAIFNGEAPHYFIDIEEPESFDDDEEDDDDE